MSQIPLDYGELRAAVENRVFPDERYWIDFKRGLYPGRPGEAPVAPTTSERKKAHRELARDAASMAIRGGYLIYGVEEDRPNFSFDPVEMPLEPGVRETVNQAISTQTSPSLQVLTHVLPNPDGSGLGFLVVEVLESPEAPHMTAGVFHGRSDTGRTTLDEPEVERLILRRHRQQDRLSMQMALTAAHDPGSDQRGSAPRAYLTAVPTRGHRDMFRSFTRLQSAAPVLWPHSAEVMNEVARQLPQPSYAGGELADMTYVRRGQRIGGIWHRSWDETSAGDGMAYRALGIGDDGEVRFLRFQTGRALTVEQSRSVILNGPIRREGVIAGVLHESDLLRHIHAFVRLTGVLARQAHYTGSWLIGLEIHGLGNYVSERHNDSMNIELGYRIQILDEDRYQQTARVTTSDLLVEPSDVVRTLTRPLLRSLDREDLLAVSVVAPT